MKTTEHTPTENARPSKSKSPYEYITRHFGTELITMRFCEEGKVNGYVDIEVTDAFCRANGYPGGIRELLYHMGASPADIHERRGLPEWVRYWHDGRVTSTETKY